MEWIGCRTGPVPSSPPPFLFLCIPSLSLPSSIFVTICLSVHTFFLSELLRRHDFSSFAVDVNAMTDYPCPNGVVRVSNFIDVCEPWLKPVFITPRPRKDESLLYFLSMICFLGIFTGISFLYEFPKVHFLNKMLLLSALYWTMHRKHDFPQILFWV